MDLKTFLDSLQAPHPPKDLTVQLASLWHDAKGDWETAHDLVNDLNDAGSAWVHAYLHRKEGDAGNAAYWYRRAGKPVAHTSLQEEWQEITEALLANE